MNTLYKRFITIGMISFTAILAWIYCVLEYRSSAVYIVSISLVLIVSVYALLHSLVSLRAEKEAALKLLINETVSTYFKNNKANDNTDLERVVKALYVMLRKTNSTVNELSQANDLNSQTNIDSYSKLLKILIKYNKDNGESVNNSISELNQQIDTIHNELEFISAFISSGALTDSLKQGQSEEPAGISDAASFDTDTSLPEDDSAEVIPFPSTDQTVPQEFKSDELVFDVAENEKTEETAFTVPPVDDPNKTLTPEEIAALFASVGGNK